MRTRTAKATCGHVQRGCHSLPVFASATRASRCASPTSASADPSADPAAAAAAARRASGAAPPAPTICAASSRFALMAAGTPAAPVWRSREGEARAAMSGRIPPSAAIATTHESCPLRLRSAPAAIVRAQGARANWPVFQPASRSSSEKDPSRVGIPPAAAIATAPASIEPKFITE